MTATKLTTDQGYRLAYIVSHETYYADRNRKRELNIVKQADDARGCAWEFCIVEHPGIGVKVGVFHDAYDAFAEIAGFFDCLAAAKPTFLDEVRDLLDELGFTDVTEREASNR